jgi:hypothetical protein
MNTYLSSAVDSDQYVKTQFLNTFVKEETVREPLQQFVNAQAQFARQSIAAVEDLIDVASKYDFLGAFEQALKPYKAAA